MENSQKPNERRDFKQADRTAYLIAGFLKETLSKKETEELDDWINASEENMILFEKMTDEKNVEQATVWFKKMHVEAELQETKRNIQQRKSIFLWPYAIAAAVIVVIVGGIYMFKGKVGKPDTVVVSREEKDLLPGTNMAILTLDNGQQIVLESNGADTMINGQVKLLRKDGQLVYNNTGQTTDAAYNTLTVPRKGRYKLVLPDGTRVWLNAASSVRYPVAFTGDERKVFITGETFFEVAKDKAKPFRVVAGNVTVEALGTQFNVNAYSNEPFLAATLIEGSVRITAGSKENLLKPGQQAQITNDGFSVLNTDVGNVIAWKENQFKFSGTSLDEIMRQVERWYDADVVFNDNVNLHLNATIERGVPVSKLLHILEQTGQVHFKIDGKKIIVMQ